MEQLVPYPHNQNPDYLDSLLPGYRFCPTDLEILVYYLKPRLERREHPPCRLHEVNIYNHDPEELAERYRPCDDSWYFLTPVERKYTNGTRSNRITKNLGLWKASQSSTTVYDDVNGGGLAVGTKTSLAYFDDKGDKTQWLMLEYKIDDPNYLIKGNDNKVLDLVLCKMYKTIRKDNKRKQEKNKLDNESPSRQQRLSMNQDDNVLQRQIQTQDHLQSSNLTSMQPTTTSHDSTILPQYVNNSHNNKEDIQAPMNFQSPIQSTTTYEDDFSCIDDQYPLDFPSDQYNNNEDIQAPMDFQTPIDDLSFFFDDQDPLDDPSNDQDSFPYEDFLDLK